MDKKFEVLPPPAWVLGPEDLLLTPEQFLSIPRFHKIRKSPSDLSLEGKLRKCHGTLVLRRYQKGQEIFHEGMPGASAFCILSSADVYGLRSSVQAKLQKEQAASRAATEELTKAQSEEAAAASRRKLGKLAVFLRAAEDFLAKVPVPAGHDPMVLETAHQADRKLAELTKQAEAAGVLARAEKLHRLRIARAEEKRGEVELIRPSDPVLADLLTAAARTQCDDPAALVIKDPTATAPGRPRNAKMYERELFGEMACQNRRPRSASVQVARDCYIVEMLGNVLDLVASDKLLEAEMDETYRRRILELHLRELSLFRHLPDPELERLCSRARSGVNIVSYSSGDVLCKQGDPSDCIFLIRWGWVQIRVDAGPDPQRVLTYRAPGDVIGEMGLIHATWSEAEQRAFRNGDFSGEPSGMPPPAPRLATCIAVAHPDLGTVKERGDVEVIKISYEELWRLLKISPGLREELGNKSRERQQETESWLASPMRRVKAGELFSESLQPLGLYLGQQLMVIDLDSCTRCDECVQACVKTHDDGRSRLFLDGPRIDFQGRPHLVPATCRSCLDPICMIGCPTRAIQRGGKGEMVINADWCIGCAGCANKCPYGAIYMHEIGIIPTKARGWFYRPAAALSGTEADTWFKLPARTRGWQSGTAPFTWTRTFRESLLPPSGRGVRTAAIAAEEPICFLHPFELKGEQVSSDGQYILELPTIPGRIRCWVDGQPIAAPEKAQPSQFTLAGQSANQTGQHLLALLVEPRCDRGATFLDVRLDRFRRPQGPPDIYDEFIEKQKKPRLAVVCDLCSALPAGPACVRACPHDAARRFPATSSSA